MFLFILNFYIYIRIVVKHKLCGRAKSWREDENKRACVALSTLNLQLQNIIINATDNNNNRQEKSKTFL